ncbi:MAG: CBS domain-containing protein [Gemmatimonadota bacterium]|nr:CBS domain-containing protein [Gemmatimonadota bacterium]
MVADRGPRPDGPALSASQIAPRLEATSFAELLDELGAFAAAQPAVADRERLLREISGLGGEDTIALGGGAFLPHLRSDAVERPMTVLGVTESSLRVPTAGEETRGRVFALVAAPKEAGSAYLEEVATIAHMLRAEGVVDSIAEAETAEEVASLGAVRDAPRVQKLSVVDVMDPVSSRVYPEMELRDAARLMARGRHSGLPVVNKRDEIVGMISEKDLIRAFLPGYLRAFEGGEDVERASQGKSVKDVMSKAVMCLPTDASISEAASIIVNKNVDPLPLTRDGKWVGLISRRSLIRKLLQF